MKIEKSDKADWSKAEVEAKSNVDLTDYGGDPRIIREFKFSFNPDTMSKIARKELAVPTHQELFNAHMKQIEIMLWGDGLVPDTDHQPRLVIGKKKYKIVLACKIREGVILGAKNKVHTITDLLKGVA